MARYLAYTSPARGHLYPIVATPLELHRRGHTVHLRTLASEVPVLRSMGLHAGAITPAIEKLPLEDWTASTPEDALVLALRTFGKRSAHEVADLQHAISQVDPDVLLLPQPLAGNRTSQPYARIGRGGWAISQVRVQGRR